MISRGLLLVLLVLTCLQSFTTAQSVNEPATCCFSYHRSPIPIGNITEYKVTDRHCTKPGVIFTLKKSSRQVCVDPELKWVQRHMERLYQILNERLNKP
ncbi:C-C motif chemokine 3-like [Silurus meridionalis]|uniref:C-C motif chemokine 3-like n=1 Tax=Silurus meridionalis TaxID=175797 RepID=UPI001EEA0CEC|nr:C-C motif chemokine 3-like [Silurus meridionalis]